MQSGTVALGDGIEPASHKLSWAKRRALRRRDGGRGSTTTVARSAGAGVVVRNVVGSMDQLSMIDRRLPRSSAWVSFNQGRT
jgi:hypothetical protein